MKVLITDITLYDLLKDFFSEVASMKTYKDFDVIIEDFNSFKRVKEYGYFSDVDYKKKLGSVLINFIDVYENEIDAITTIFENNANAVIYLIENANFKFVDALGNVWYEGSKAIELAQAIKAHYLWSSSAKRVKSESLNIQHLIGMQFEIEPQIEKFIELNKKVADKFELIKGRYFGNCSTRCSEMFPTANLGDCVLVSKRNVPKARLTTSEMVVVKFDNIVNYYGESKPSVDTPIQCEIYKLKPEIKYMIHGHTYIENAVITDNYYPCGDMREVDEILNKIDNSGVLNLRNHGFLIYADTIENLEELINNSKFIEREVGFEKTNITFNR